MRQKICGIYKITNPKGKVYIGQSIDCHKRMCSYKRGDCSAQIVLYASIKKYGWGNHCFEIIHCCSLKELNDLEKHYIAVFDTYRSKLGMNLKQGGSETPEEEMRRKKGYSQIGNKNALGKKHKPGSHINHFRRPVNQLSLDGVFIKRWKHAKEVEQQAGFSYSTINGACKGHSLTAFGYKWRFADISELESESIIDKARKEVSKRRRQIYINEKVSKAA